MGWHPMRGPTSPTERIGRQVWRALAVRKTTNGLWVADVTLGKRLDDSPIPRLTQFSMRHSYGTAPINAGVETSKLSRLIGRVDVSTTLNRYMKQRIGDLRSETRVLKAVIGDVL